MVVLYIPPRMAHRIFITGAAGYIGGMLCEQLAQRPDVDYIVALDKAPMPQALQSLANMRWIVAATNDPSWTNAVAAEQPDIVIHAAWQIRDLYGRPHIQRQFNVDGSHRVFDFAFNTPSVRRLVHLSSVSAYGATADNRIEHRFREADRLRPSDVRYAEEKREVEDILERGFTAAKAAGKDVSVSVLRPAAVTGPRGRNRDTLVGLQAALCGDLNGNVIQSIVRLLTSFVPVTSNWCRQFIHEDDIADIAVLAALGPLNGDYEVLIASPPGDALQPRDIADAFGKRLLRVHPQLVRLAFALAWHGTRGRIPTSRGTWKPYSYPIVVDGSKLTEVYGYNYRMDSKAAFTRNVGRYAQ